MYRSFFQHGFTLIELLVTVAIIGLLASVVLVSLDESRNKSENAAKIEQIRQYKVALDLAYVANGNQYPWNGGSALQPSHRGCLFDSAGGGCNYNGSLNFMYPDITPLDQMIKLGPLDPPVVESDGDIYDGVLYASNGDDFWLDYPMEGPLASDSECGIGGAQIYTTFNDVTICRYDSSIF